MLRNLKKLQGYALRAADGDVGRIREFYFDDDYWTVRYLAVDLDAKQVLISPVYLGGIDDDRKVVQVTLSKEQVQESPSSRAATPIPRQQERRFFSYYAWAPYWLRADRWGTESYPSYLSVPGIRTGDIPESGLGDPDLRSTGIVGQYRVAALDGELGTVDDLIADDNGWVIRYLVVDAGAWLPGRKIVLSPLWINRVSWSSDAIMADVPRQVIRDAPPYDPSRPITGEYEERLAAYYGSSEYTDTFRRETEKAALR
jgi:hypothetical protein